VAVALEVAQVAVEVAAPDKLFVTFNYLLVLKFFIY
jgi:hypothetical protein